MRRITLQYDKRNGEGFSRSSIKLTQAEYDGLKRLIKDVPPLIWLTNQALMNPDVDNFTQYVRDLIITGGKND